MSNSDGPMGFGQLRQSLLECCPTFVSLVCLFSLEVSVYFRTSLLDQPCHLPLFTSGSWNRKRKQVTSQAGFGMSLLAFASQFCLFPYVLA